MRHEFDRLGPDSFEHMIQALTSSIFGIRVKTYGDGPDRQREAVVEDADDSICDGVKALGRTIIQAKYKSPDGKQGDWDWLRKNLKEELDGFVDKAKADPAFVPKTWVFFTNVVLTPAKGGLRDKVDEFVGQDKYRKLIPHIYVLGADDIRAMLDANSDVARRYAAFLTPGDALADALDYLERLELEPLNSLMEYVNQRFQADEPVRLEQAGNISEGSIAIQNVYIDLEAEGNLAGEDYTDGLAATILELGDRPHNRRDQRVASFGRAASAYNAPEYNIVLIGNAGQGKSTLCQFICQLYRATLLEHYRPEVKGAHGYAGQSGIQRPKCERFPFLIRLKDYAAWIRRMQDEGEECTVLHYLIALINKADNIDLQVSVMRKLLGSYSWIFVFDGLDEVPVSSNRAELLKQIDSFLSKDLTEARCDSLVICTSRPQGYDAAFSPMHYQHLELMDMSPEYCLRYIDRLLNYLEQSEDYREKYRSILRKSLDDPLVAKLMTTPLYTAILVLLVKSGSVPPTRRYELFNKYCEIVQQRELQKKLLPSLYDGNYTWVKEVHGLIGYLLQFESETAVNVAAELSSERCHKLIRIYLEEDEWDGDRERKANELYHAITERLPFLAETTDAENNNCVLFPLRSLQEFFAAEYLLQIDDSEKRRDIIKALSLSAYWRNVLLFVAGRYSMENRRSVNDSIYAICEENNGSVSFPNLINATCRIALPGSRLALDLLCDNLFERKRGQERYLRLVAKLLNWDNDAESGLFFAKLPTSLRYRFTKDYVIPRVRESRDPNETAFSLLLEEAVAGNNDACKTLEELADTLMPPTSETLSRLLIPYSKDLGANMLNRILEWLLNDLLCMSFVISADVLTLLERCCLTLNWKVLPALVHRYLAYYYLSISADFDDVLTDAQEFCNLYKRDQLLSAVMLIRKNKMQKRGLIGHELEELINKSSEVFQRTSEQKNAWDEFGTLCGRENLVELEALAEYCCQPNAEKFAKLLNAWQELDGVWYEYFAFVLRHLDLLFSIALFDFEETAKDRESKANFLARCDTTYYQNVRERERRIIAALKEHDYYELTKQNAWAYLPYLPHHYLSPESSEIGNADWVLAGIREANEESFWRISASLFFSRPLYGMVGERGSFTMNDGIRRAVLNRFSNAFHHRINITVVLYAFSQESHASLIQHGPTYPTCLPSGTAMRIDSATVRAILDRITFLGKLGESSLEAYSLLPYFFDSIDQDALIDMSSVVNAQYKSIKATGNYCALLGATLILLTDENLMDRRDELTDVLHELMDAMEPRVWQGYYAKLSLAGRLLVHEVGMDVYRNTEHEGTHFALSRLAILQGLEALPANREKLPAPGDLTYFNIT